MSKLEEILFDPDSINQVARVVASAIGENDQVVVDELERLANHWLDSNDDAVNAVTLVKLFGAFTMLNKAACHQFALLVEEAKLEDGDATPDDSAVQSTSIYFLNTIVDNITERRNPG